MKTINNEDISTIVELHQDGEGFGFKNLLLKGCPNKELNKKLKEMEVPVVTENTGKIVPEGYLGESLEDILVRLLESANGDLEKAQKGVVILENFEKWRIDDKYLTEKMDMTRSYKERMESYYFEKNNNLHQQMALIPYLKGEVIPIMVSGKKVSFDTSELTMLMFDNYNEKITNPIEMNNGYHDIGVLSFINFFCEYSEEQEKEKEFAK